MITLLAEDLFLPLGRVRAMHQLSTVSASPLPQQMGISSMEPTKRPLERAFYRERQAEAAIEFKFLSDDLKRSARVCAGKDLVNNHIRNVVNRLRNSEGLGRGGNGYFVMTPIEASSAGFGFRERIQFTGHCLVIAERT